MNLRIRLDTSSLTARHQSGVASYTRLLERALSADENIVFLPTPRPPMPLRLYAKLQSYNLAPPYDLFLTPVDVTIFPNFATWPTIHSNKTATVIHDLTYLYYPELVAPANLRYLRRVIPQSIKKTDRIITVSEALKAEIVKEFGVAPARIIVTPIPPAPEFCQKSNIDVKTKYNIPNSKYIYFLGNMEPRKNLPTLIRAYRLLPGDIKQEYALVIAGGKGWKTEATEAELRSAQAAGEKIVHIGFIDQADSPALYQNASLFVMPSLYEGFGMPVLEAMASGTKVLCSDIPVLREVGGEACTYAAATNPDDFAQQMVSALNAMPNPKLTRENLTRFSWDRNAEAIIRAV